MLKMYTTTWCPDCRRAKRFLADRHIAFEEINIEETPGADVLVREHNQGKARVPTFDLEGRYFASSPFDPVQLARDLQAALKLS